VLASHVDVHCVFIHTCYGVNWDEKVTLADTKEAARTNLDHADLPFRLVDKEAADVPDLICMSIESFATANILIGISERKAGVRQFDESGTAGAGRRRPDLRIELNLFQDIPDLAFVL
jgi:hypothetical protein